MTKTDRIEIRCTRELKESVEAAAKKENRTVANWIECVLIKELENKKRGE